MAFAYKRKITIDSTKIDATLTNYPVQVLLNDSNFDFTKAKADGSDIRFADVSDNLLKHEKVEYNPGGSGQGAPPPSIGKFNVQIPEVSSTTDTEFYMYYGNPDAYNTSIEAWQDQTGKALTYNGNVKLEYDSTLGKRKAVFDGSGDYFTIPYNTDFSFGANNFVLEMTLNIISGVNGSPIVRMNCETSMSKYAGIGLNFYSTNGLQLLVSTNGSAWATTAYATGVFTTGTSHHLAVARNGSTITVYVDGVSTSLSYLIGTNSVYSGVSGGYSYVADGFAVPTAQNVMNVYGMRITNGRARYTSNFTPPTSFEIDGDDVVLCTNFDTIYDANYVMVQHMGDSLVDSTGNGNNGTNYGTTVVDGLNGKARRFDGDDDYIELPDFINANSDHTISFVFNRNSINDSTAGDMVWRPTNEDYLLTFGDGLDNNTLSVRARTGSWNNFGRISTSINETIFATFIRDYTVNSISTGYKNGVKGIDYSLTSTGSATNSHALGASKAASITREFKGTIDEVRISNIARSDAWIKADDYNYRLGALINISSETETADKHNVLFFGFNF